MLSIKIFDDLYIVAQKVGTPEEGILKMDSLEIISFFSKQKPKVFSKTENDRKIYFPALGNYLFYSKPQGNYHFENEDAALDKAVWISERINRVYQDGESFCDYAKEHIKKHRPGTLKNSYS